MEIDLSGRTAFVSGSTQGIGRAIAANLAGAGADVVVNGRGAERVEAIAAELGTRGIAADVATADGAASAVRPAAGRGHPGEQPGHLRADPGHGRGRRHLAALLGRERDVGHPPDPPLRAGHGRAGWGRVQFMASDSAVVIPAEMVHYGVTKTALLGVSRGFAKALSGTGVTVNTVMAGPTHTEGVEQFVRDMVGDDKEWDEAQAQFMAEHRPHSLIERLIEPEEIANMVTYLSSDAASATTGGALRVDGGYVDNIVP